ncbi:MAG: penicillin-binding protein 2, partial [Elusimicrobia bacterium RIFOXYB2_FULL_49_7]
MVWQQEHRLAYEDFLEKYRIVVILFLGLFLMLAARLFHLQVVKGKHFRTLSEQQRTQIILERAPRGIIYDRKGDIIVGNRTSFVALFYPFSQDFTPPRETLERVGKILPIKNVTAHITRCWRNGQVVRLAENLSRAEMFQLLEQRLVLPGISVVKEARREYRASEANSHLIGYLNEITRNELDGMGPDGYKMGDWLGRRGLEKVYDPVLRGQDGGWQIEVDAMGRQTRLVRHIPSTIGSSLYTTIDARLQEIAGEAMKKTPTGRGAVVGIDPRTGAIRVLVSSPGYDPNTSFSSEFRKYLVDKSLPLFNRAIQGLYPPGSTFKIITFLGAVNEHKIDLNQTYHCNGAFTFGNKTFKCWEKKGHGTLSLVDALAKSCNVYFYQVGLRVGPKILESYARKFHIGEVTGAGLPSEKAGLVPSEEWKRKKLHEPWHQGDTINMAIGQGPLWTTPMQMAQMMSIVASRGEIYQPYIVEKITTPNGELVSQFTPKKKGEFKLPKESWDILIRALGEVVQNGTAHACYFPDLKIGGKTGTAQNPHGDSHAWIVAFAPLENPELALAIVVENGGSGGAIAGP